MTKLEQQLCLKREELERNISFLLAVNAVLGFLDVKLNPKNYHGFTSTGQIRKFAKTRIHGIRSQMEAL